MVFENTRNTKNKNTPPSPNMFLVFFVFKNRKQLLKTITKQPRSPYILHWGKMTIASKTLWDLNRITKIGQLMKQRRGNHSKVKSATEWERYHLEELTSILAVQDPAPNNKDADHIKTTVHWMIQLTLTKSVWHTSRQWTKYV